VTWLEGAATPTGSPGWPFVEILLGWLGAEIGEPEIAIRTKARAVSVRCSARGRGVLQPLAVLLRIRLDTRP
jgi:hypothetical protein